MSHAQCTWLAVPRPAIAARAKLAFSGTRPCDTAASNNFIFTPLMPRLAFHKECEAVTIKNYRHLWP